MARERQQTESDEPQGAPEWMVTFSDCMTLLLTFFVLLLSFSSFDNQAFQQLNQSMVTEFSALTLNDLRPKDAANAPINIAFKDDLSVGSEQATQNPLEIGNMKSTDMPGFRDQKVFFLPSSQIFWAKGNSISADGKAVLSNIAKYLKNFPNRFVIYEGPHSADSEFTSSNINRTWTVIDYMCEEGNIDRNKFSLASCSTLPQSIKLDDELAGQRLLEIIMVERSISQ